MCSVKWDAEREVHQAVVSPQVVGPQERLSAQIDVGREEAEHGVQDGHLQQAGQATRHRIHSSPSVQFHGLLLTLHGVFLVTFVDLVQFGSEHAHPRGAHEVFPCDGREGHLDDERQHQNDEPASQI